MEKAAAASKRTPIPSRRTANAASSGGAAEIQTQGGANQPASLGAGGNKASNETGDESKIEQVNVVNTTTTEKDSFGGTAKKATVSVGIPASYYEKVWKEQNPTKEGEEAKKPDRAAVDKIREKITQDVRNQVATILSPLAPDVKDAASLVTVTTFQDFKPAEIQVPPPAQRALTWLGQNWPMTAMVGLVLFSLGMLRSMFRSIPRRVGRGLDAGDGPRAQVPSVRRASRSGCCPPPPPHGRHGPCAPRRAFRIGEGRSRFGSQHPPQSGSDKVASRS